MGYWNVHISNTSELVYFLGKSMYQKIEAALKSPIQAGDLLEKVEILSLLAKNGIALELWKAQNLFLDHLKKWRAGELIFQDEAGEEAFFSLANVLNIKVQD